MSLKSKQGQNRSNLFQVLLNFITGQGGDANKEEETESEVKTEMDKLALDLKQRNLSNLRAVIIFETADDGRKLKKDLQKRELSNIMIIDDYDSVDTVMTLWFDRTVEKYLIISRNVLPDMYKKHIDLLILYEIPVEDFIDQVNVTCEIICLMNGKLIHQGLNFDESQGILAAGEQDNSGSLELLENQPQQSVEKSGESIFAMGRHYMNFGVIAWGYNPVISCHSSLGVCYLSHDIREAMKELKIEQARSVQRYAWPHVFNGDPMILIGHQRCGKSWSFIPAICQRIHKAAVEGIFDWTGPICVLVAANVEDGKNTLKMLSDLMKFYSTDKMELLISLWEAPFISDAIKSLSRPCGIFITTADLLWRMHSMESTEGTIFHPGFIRCLVLDNVGDMYRKTPLLMPMLFEWIVSAFVFHKDQTQLIITSRLWMDKLMKFQIMPKLPDVLLVIEDGLEATVYGGVELSVKFLTESDYNQCQSLLKVLSDRDLEKERIVIICYTSFDAEALCEALKYSKIPYYYYDLGTREQQKTVKSYQGIIITMDEMVVRMNCDPVNLLISYALTHTWHRLKQRFNVFYTKYRAEDKSPAEAIVMLKPLETEQVWLLSDFLFKHDKDVPQDWLDHFYNNRVEREKLTPRSNVNLCMQLVSYGNCYRRNCQYRHEIRPEEFEPASHLPTNGGSLSFRLLNCTSPCNLSVRLVHMTNSAAIGNQLQTFYKKESNRINVANPSVGDIVITEYREFYERVMIIRVEPNMVQVKQVDWGTKFFCTSAENLFVCDERFRFEKNHAVNIQLTGIMPNSMDRVWSEDAKHLVRKNFFGYSGKKMGSSIFLTTVYTANIDFIFNDTVFVNNVVKNDGKDLKTFITDNLRVFDDKLVESRFLKLKLAAKEKIRNISTDPILQNEDPTKS